MAAKISKLLVKVFGSRNERLVKGYTRIAFEAGEFEEQIQKLSDEALKAKTAELKTRFEENIKTRLLRIRKQISDLIASGAGRKKIMRLKNKELTITSGVLEDMMPEAFAIVREASRRTVWHGYVKASKDYHPELQKRIRRAINGDESLEGEDAKRAVELNLYSMRHFNVQLIGGRVLCDGKIAEMATGEGKTLVATLAAYLVHLTGRKVHIVTVNDYLAKRDAEWMGPVYQSLGMTVGVIQADMDTSGDERKAQYACDVTYGTNNEFGFDYLRDNMKVSAEQLAQGPLDYAIIDEVDSILIDEARTPLIISGPTSDKGMQEKYFKANVIAKRLLQLQEKECGQIDKIDYDKIKPRSFMESYAPSLDRPMDAGSRGKMLLDAQKQRTVIEREIEQAEKKLSKIQKNEDRNLLEKTLQEIGNLREELANQTQRIEEIQQEAWLSGGQVTPFFEIDYKSKSVQLTERGIATAQKLANVGSFFSGSGVEWPHLLEQSLRAQIVFEKEKDYIVMDGKVVIVDEFTGRLMHGRQWSDGLHQAIESKENVEIKEETQTLATITLQNFFRLYEYIAGMTGTAATEAEEFMNIYNLEVVVIPSNKPCIRDDRDDIIYKTWREKLNAVVEEIENISTAGIPVMVGTTSVEKNLEISETLRNRFGKEYRHEILNAKNHAKEADIIKIAGQQHKDGNGKLRGNVTIATNMAGRGTDIKLGPGVADIGGLHIIGTERHEARRIDNQLRGRCGRQGDAGSSQFFLSFDDDLLKIFSPEWAVKALSWVGWEEGTPIQHRQISKGIKKAQEKVEQRNFEIRKNLLEYDEVMDYQRKTFYSRRREIIGGKGLKDIIWDAVSSTLRKHCETTLDKKYPLNCIIEWARTNFDVDLKIRELSGTAAEQIETLIKERAKDNAKTNITFSVQEYLEDYGEEARGSRDISGLSKWAMSTFKAYLPAGKLKQMTPEEIEQFLAEASAKQIDEKDCSRLAVFLDPDFGIKTFIDRVTGKFGIKLNIADMTALKPEQIYKKLLEQIQTKYDERQIEYPIKFAMSITYRPDGINVYAFENLAKWTNEKFGVEIPVAHLQNTSPADVYKELLKISEDYHQTGLENEIDGKCNSLDADKLSIWANERFKANLKSDDFASEPGAKATGAKEKLLQAGREFLRTELSWFEKYVLLQIFDSAWKDHLYAMDHLKEGIFMRAYAEKDPKIEYKRESLQMFQEMFEGIDDWVTNRIFNPEESERPPSMSSVWNIGQTTHNEVGQFEMTQEQATAQAPQGEAAKVKQIKLEQPKTGRNDPCPCGSGKKYKKCCGKNA